MFSKMYRRRGLMHRRLLARRRALRMELLEDRRVMTAAMWTNILQPYNVTAHPSGIVSPLDALYIINEINNPQFSDPVTGVLPSLLPENVSHGYPDVDCDQRVTPLDVLAIVNHLNGAPEPRSWVFQGSGDSSTGSGNVEVYACRPVLVERGDYRVGVTSKMVLTNENSAIEVSFYAPQFDFSTKNSVRDAVEISVLDASGRSLVLPIAPNQQAAFNWSEGLQPITAPAVQAHIATSGELSRVTINLVGVSAHTPVEVLVRLLNNDFDNETRVRLHDIRLVAATGINPQEAILDSNLRRGTGRSVASQSLEELTGSVVPSFGATRLSEDGQVLISDLRIMNASNFAISGEVILAVDAMTDQRIHLLDPDGYLADGRPFVRVESLSGGQWLAPGESTNTRDIRFRNPLDQRFSFRLTALGKIHHGLGAFVTTTNAEIEAGRTYRYSPVLKEQSDAQEIVFSKLVGPELLRVDSRTGQVIWPTTLEDIGYHTITIQAVDRFGSRVEQTFTLDVLDSLQNRPPVFVSTPETEAVAAGAFEVITLPTGSMPAGLAVGNFGVLDGASSINELSLVAINQGTQTLSVIPGLGRDGAGREIYGQALSLSVGEPPIGDDLLRSVLDVDVGLPPLGNTIYDRNRIMGMIHGDFNGDGILDVATSIVYQYRPLTGPDAYERRIAINLGRGDGTFEAPVHFPIPGPVAYTWDNTGAIAMQARDFDQDGELDLLVSETKGKKLLYYKGLGDGTFLAAQEQSTGTDISGYKVADLNGDGVLDLIAMRANGQAFGVLLGNGDGTFQPYSEFSTHTGYTVNHNFAIGDLNGDGHVDFVSGNHATRMLNVYLGNGDGTFSRGVDLFTRGVFSTSPATGDWSMALVIGDFSGNGHADIAYTTYSNSGFGVGYGGGIALYEGDGSGSEFSWSTAVDVAMSLAPINIHGDTQPIDLNGDGHLDMVFTGPGEWGNYAPGVNVALNDGTGKFTSTFWIDSNLGTHPQPSNLNNGLGVLVGDFNNDGMLDLLTARSGRQDTGNQFSSVSLMLADTPGTYRAAYDVRASSAMWGTVQFVEYADFNNDGILDLWGPAYQNASFTQLGNGDGTFAQPITATPWIGNEGLGKGFAADLDLDGNMDVVWSGQGGIQGGPQGRYLTALGNGDGTFRITYAQTGNNTPSGYAPLVMKPADFDGDGYTDFVALTGLNTIEIMRNVPETPGTFTRSYSTPFGASTLRQSLNVGDFDGDGIPDVIAVRERPGNVHDLLFYRGIGNGTLAQPTIFPFAPDTTDFRFPKHIAVGDLNSDGKLDFVINASYHRSAVVLGNGDGTFQPPMTYRTGTIFGDQGGLHLVDLNGDGNLDLVSMDDTVSQRIIEVRLGLGDGTFGTAQVWGTSEGTGQLAFGDLDNDGRIDIGINGNSRQEAVATYLGNRQGLSGVLATDINGDGRTDILAINHDNSHVKRLVSDGRGNFTRLNDLLVGKGPVDLLSGDFNGNGLTDFLTINRSGRSISVMLADGLGSYARTDVPVGRLPVAGSLAKVTGGPHDDLLVIDAQLNALFVMTQDGSGAFTESAVIPLGDKPSSIAVGDIEGDGGADVIISLAETNRLMILRSRGSGQFADPIYVNLPAKPGKISAGDLNGDGLLDLAVTFPETGEVALLLGMGQSRFTQPQRIRVGERPDSIVMADANGDGLLDILVTNAGDDTASVILNRFDPNQLYRYQALANDPDDDPVTYSILEGPGGMILNAATGEIRWAPTGDQVGTPRVVLEASDGRGGRTTQEFSISVEAVRINATPVITTAPPTVVSAQHAFTTTVIGNDPDGDRLRYRLVDGPPGATLDPVTGRLDWDPRGTAIQMNRVAQANGFVQLPHTAAQIVNSLTVEGWFRFAKTDGNQVLIDKAFNWVTPGFFTLRYFSGNLQFLIGNGTSAGTETLSLVRSLPTEEWIHLSATFDDATGEMVLLINGIQVASRVTSKRIGIPGENIPLRVGQDVYPFHGDVYGFRMWNSARLAAQIREGLHHQMPFNTPNLVVDLRFSEGDSLSVINHAAPNHRGLTSGTVVPKRIVGMTPVQSAQFTVSVEDGKGGFDQQTFSVAVAPKLPGSVTGTLFSDENRDGLRQAGEASLAGWTMFIDRNNNGYRDADDPFAITNGSGVYQFNQLLQGDYTIAVEPRAGFKTPAARNVSIVSQQVTNSDIAAQPLSPGQVRGRLTQADSLQTMAHQHVFADLNGNELWDDGEPNAKTDVEGRYIIGGLAAGSYSLRVQTQPAWQVTEPASAAHDVVLASNDLLEDLDFVIQPSNTLAAAAPQIVTEPPRSAAAGQPYRYAVSAVSRDGRPVTYSLSLAPTGMVIDARTGQIAWTPTGKQTGNQQLIIRAATDNSHVDLQSFFIEVAPANSAPIVTSTPASPASVGRLWSYQVMAQDAEQTEFTYSLSVAPTGALIDADSGLITWTPLVSQTGAHAFNILVQDNAGSVTQHTFTLDVVSETHSTLPFTIRSPRDNASLLTPYLSRVSGVDASGQALTASLVSAPDGLTLDASGFIEWSPTVAQLGVQSLSVRFNSASGSSEEHTYSVSVRQTIGNSAPQIQSNPMTLFAVAGQLYTYDLSVADSDNDALSFELVTAPAGMSIHPQLGTLRWLPTIDQLGQSFVTIRVTDPQGGSDTHSFALTTRRLGGPPLIQSIPSTQAAIGIGYLYTVQVVDAENDPLTFSLIEAPIGMSIDSRTGEIAWTPTTDQLGQQSVFIAVADASGNRSTQGFSIQVAAGLPNRPPVISSQPHLFATVGEAYSTMLQATDPEGSVVTYSLRRGPEGMTVHPTTGQVGWTPTAGQVGRAIVTLVATDAQGGASVQAFEIDVLGINIPPDIISTPPAFAWARGLFQYDVLARDSDRDPIRYEFVSSVPDGMTIDPLGRIRWQTQANDAGSYSITIQASDPRGGLATQQIDFEVRADNLPPKVTVLPRAGGWPWDGPIVVYVSAVDNVGVMNVELRVNGQLVPLDTNRTARLNFDDWGPGVLNMEAHAWDAAGNYGTGSATAFYRDPQVDYESGEGLPVATIASPSEDGTVFGMVQIIGTAIGGTAAATGFKEYRLSYAREDNLQFTEFVRSTTSVADGLLGVWDTTLLENDAYVLRLEVISEAGNTSVHETTVGLSGNLKLGNFRLSFEDLTIPVAGIPITIVRTYDTLRADRDGDFGYGWRLEYRNTDLRVSLPKSGLEDLGIYTPFRSGTKIYLTLPGGQRVGWTFTPEFRVLPGWAKGNDLVMASPRYTPDRGNTATLSAGGGWLTVNPFGELYAAGGMPWNPASPDFGGGFTVTMADGTRYFIDGTTGLMQSVADRNGNILTFSDSGIISSLGDVGISIARDRHGRITSITDPAGNAIRYGYSTNGDLIRVTDREGHSTTMTYRTDRSHYLDTVVDPLGRTGIRTNFSDQGRLTSLTMADGTVRQMDYDPDNHFVLITDSLGRISVIGYDAFGNQVSHTDALGGESRFVFNDLNLPVEYRDPLGRITRYSHDSAGNITSIIDPSGGITYQAFGSFGRLETVTDVLGATTRSELDSRGNPIRIRDGAGNLTSISYSVSGDPSATVVSGVGAIQTTIVNQRLLSITDAAGTVARHEYDGAGYMTASIVMLYTDDGIVEVRREFSHDANGRLHEVVDAVGGRTLYSYDAVGNRTSTTDPLGRITNFAYDSMNRLIRTTYPDGLTETKQYDLVGNLIRFTDRGGRSTHYQYDAANRPTVIILPDPTPDDLADNPRRAFEYDLAGQLIAVIDEQGYRTTYSYGTASRPTAIIDPLGQSTRITYDLADRKVSHIDPNGHVTRWTYDLSGNPIETIYGNGEVERLQFNARNEVIARTNAIGETTRYEYDPLGRITAVVDPLGNRTTHHYDSLGRLSRTVDALGRQTRFSYDLEDRMLSKTLPDGSTQTYEYDLAGQLTREVDFAGQASTYLHDVLGRVVESRRSEETLEFSYTSTGRIAEVRDDRGITQYDYDELDRVLKRTDPDGLFVDYTYDQRGNVVSIRTASSFTQYIYDALSRPVVVTDSAGLETEFAYDAASNLVQTRYWNGLVELRQHDARGRVLQIDLESPTELLSRYTYRIDAAGRRTSLTELDGSQSTYEYDASGRLIKETHSTSAGGQRSIQYEYDAVGNRLATFDTASGTTLYTYDSRDQLITLTDATGQTNRFFDANGNLISIVPENGDRQDFVWDSAGRLTRVTRGAQGILEAEYVYDHRGQRIQILDARGQRRLLIDDNRPLALVLEELHAEPTSTIRHTYDPSTGARISLTTGAQPMIVHGDHLGSTRLLSNSNGQITDRISYTGFGDLLARDGVTPVEWLYTGESRDSSSGMYYLRARYYDPATGRFISQDPFAGFQNDPLSLHRYVYAHLNPISNRDPSGEYTLIEALQGIQLQSVLQYGLINGAISGLLASISGGSIMRGFFSGFFLGAAGGAAGQFFINSQRLLHADKLQQAAKGYSALSQKVVELGGAMKVNKKVAEELIYAAPGFLRGLEELPNLESKIRLASIVLTLASDFGLWGLSLYWQFKDGFKLDTSLPSSDPIFGINPERIKDYFPNKK